jgi:3-hydroxy-9,10-secoandrosta-1,3,5(10)-triene-9,17-dione monooxygenase reductase component
MISPRQPHEVHPIEARTLRRVCGMFVTGVTVITVGVDGHATGTTVNSVTSVSLEPPLVLFCLHAQSRLHGLLERSGNFAVNFLAGKQESVARRFAGRHTADFEDVAHHRSSDGVPVLSEALAYLSCRIVNQFEGGDHWIILGEVTEMGSVRRRQEPLIFFEGNMSVLDGGSPFHPMWDG